jgi:hypothetical protein
MTTELTRKMPAQEICAKQVFVVSMVQLVLGAALGFILGQGVLQGAKRVAVWLACQDMRERIRGVTHRRGSALIAGFIKYAGAFGVVAALITFGVWSVSDYLTARSARSVATANVLDPSAAVLLSGPGDSSDVPARLTPESTSNSTTAVSTENIDPYADTDFKVQRRPHRPGTPVSLKETLVARSEARARADLLRQTQEHIHRSQYDCEAAERANKYLQAGLDVWGFANWQLKYFPTSGYKGATLPQCKGINNVLGSS